MSLDCPSAEILLSRYLDGELPPEGRGEVEAHLRECAGCRAALDAWARIGVTSIDVLRQEIPAAPARKANGRRPGRLRARPRSSWFPGLIAAAALIGIAGLIILLSGESPREIDVPAVPPEVADDPPAVPPPAPARAVRIVKAEPKPSRDLRPPKSLPPAPEAPRRDTLPETPAPAKPAPPKPPPVKAPEVPAKTIPVVAVVRKAQGEVHVDRAGTTVKAQEGTPLPAGSGIRTVGPDSSAKVAYVDSTRLEIGPETTILGLSLEKGKRLFLRRGEIRAVVSRQPGGKPMVIETPHGEAQVLGTTLRIHVAEGTRLEVEKGRVRLKRTDGRTALVTSGHFAVAAPGRPPVARRVRFGPNLLANPGFEQGGIGWDKAVSGMRSVVTVPVHSGARAQQHKIEENLFFHELGQVVPVEPGAQFEAGGWIQPMGIDGDARVELQWLRGPLSGPGLPPASLLIRTDVAGSVNGTKKWTRVRDRVRAPAEARFVRFRILTDVEPDGSAMAWFDDLFFSRVR